MNPVASDNYFQLFSLSEQFDLDLTELRSRYRVLQQTLHPDRHAASGRQDQLLAMQYASTVNDAYQVLREPLRRARYLLQLKGRICDANDSRELDPCFLMKQMEMREELAEARDAENPEQVLECLHTDVGRELKELESVIAGQFRDGSAQALDRIPRLLAEMQFMEKLRVEVESTENELLDG